MIPYFKMDSEKNFDPEFMLTISTCMDPVSFQQFDILMKMGDYGDEMYINFQGMLGIYLDNDCVPIFEKK